MGRCSLDPPQILLFSGGIDSYVAWHYLNKPQTIYFDLNTPYTKKEVKVVRKLIPSTVIEKVIDFSSRQIGNNAYVPYRNLHLALLANKYSDEIVIAGLKDDVVNDKNKDIFKKFSKLMSSMMEKEIKVTSPFWDMTKEDVVKWFLENGGTKEELLSTISCYNKSKKNYCGNCPSCFRKWCALRANGIEDLPFHNMNIMLAYKERANAGIYIKERNKTILRELKRYGI